MNTPQTRRRRAFVVLILFVSAAWTLRAQVTESPHTVKPGSLLIEMDGLRLSMDRAEAAGNKYTALGVASTIVTAGLTQTLDVQIGLDLFLRETFEIGGARDSRSGVGDVSLRVKWTFWRDERLGAALAIIPYVRVPTSSGGIGADAVEGGFIVPWAMHVGGGVTAGAMFQWDVVRNDADNGYDANWNVSGFVQRPLTQFFSVYGEATIHASSTGLSHWAGSIGIGALWNLTSRLQLDYELMRGMNSRATDWTHVARVNWQW